jgi:hypothetical protein
MVDGRAKGGIDEVNDDQTRKESLHESDQLPSANFFAEHQSLVTTIGRAVLQTDAVVFGHGSEHIFHST